MPRVNIPRASTRIIPERNHREIMQRARAFRIFEIQCALINIKHKISTSKELIEYLQDSKTKLKEDIIEIETDSGNEIVIDSPRQQLLTKRAILIQRLKKAEEKFGSQFSNLGDVKELNLVDVELDQLSRTGKAIIPHPKFTLESVKSRLVGINKEIKVYERKLLCQERMDSFLHDQFDRAYDDEEEVDDDDDPNEDDEFKAYQIRKASPDSGEEEEGLEPLIAMKDMLVPSLPERDASKFFLLAHMLDYLCDTQGFDLHGKVFYDLTGSRGKLVTAAQYCLQDGGKLTSELGEWASTLGLHSGVDGSTRDFGDETSVGGGSDDGSKFAQYKRQKEEKKREALLKAEQEALEFERQAEEDDAQAEALARASGKITAEDVEANQAVWPFNQVYAVPVSEEEESLLEGELVKTNQSSMISFEKEPQLLLTQQPLSALREVAMTSRAKMMQREAVKAQRLEELLVRGQAFEYQKTVDPRWSRIVSFEATWDSANEARELVEIGLPRRKSKDNYSAFSPTENDTVPSTIGSSCNMSSAAMKEALRPSLPKVVKNITNTINSSSTNRDQSASYRSKMSKQSGVKGKDAQSLARSLRRRRSHIEVRETDFVGAGHDWEDGDVVYFDTGSDLYLGMDEGILVMKLEEKLKVLQPGSFAIIVTRTPYQMIDPDSDQLKVIMNTVRLLQGGEKISAWLVKITQATKKRG